MIRDLITGPKRFTDLMDRLGGITPKTLSQRLTELEDAGIVIADREPARWHFRLDATDYLAESNGAQWTVTASPPPAPADVTITTTTQSLAALIFTGSDAGVDITGETGAAERFRQLISTMAAVVQPV